MKNIQNCLISSNSSVREAISVIEKSGVQIALVVKYGKLIGTITDGDIRRAFLNKNIKLNDSLKAVINRDFKYVTEKNINKKFILDKMKKEELRHIPVLDKRGNLKDFFFINDLLDHSEYNNEIVIMAGGKGTRLGKLTKNCPKPMLKINKKPILEIILEQCINQGFNKFSISVNYLKNQIKDYFKNGSKLNVYIDYLEEKFYSGTAGSLSLFKKKPIKPFIVINGDVLSKINLKNLIDFHDKYNSDITLCIKKYYSEIPYGTVDLDGYKVNFFEEKPVIIKNVNAGIYMINPTILKIIPKKRYIDMTELINLAKRKKFKINAFPIYEYWQDLGDYKNIIQTEKQWE